MGEFAAKPRRAPRETGPPELPPGWIERLVRCAILAPSSHNTQPWSFAMGYDYAELWADRSRQLHVADPDGRELILSCGAALMNLRVACHRFGHESTVTLLPEPDEPDLLAYSGCGPTRPASLEDQRLFEAVFRRRTHRRHFESQKLGDTVAARLAAAAEREGAWLMPIEGTRRRQLGELIEEATREQFRDREFRVELASWLRPRGKAADGIPGHALGLGALSSRLAPWILRGFDLSDAQAARDREFAETAPLLAVLGTDRDGRLHRLRGGQALERVLLTATAEGLSASYLNSPVQVESFRTQLAGLIGADGAPQIVMRLGPSRALRPLPRRPLADVIKPLA